MFTAEEKAKALALHAVPNRSSRRSSSWVIAGLMDSKKILREPLNLNPSDPAPSDDLQALKKQIQDLEFELDVLKEVAQVLVKGPGVAWIPVSNREKIVIVDALENRYLRSKHMVYLAFPHSSYYDR